MCDIRNFVFNGKSMADFSAYVSADEIDRASERKVDTKEVAGKNGDVIIDSGRYANVTHSYGLVITHDYETNLAALRNYLLSQIGYKRLEDTYYPDEYYLAYFVSGFEPVTKPHRNAGAVKVEFSRKPQRFLKAGGRTKIFTASGSIYNPTPFEAQPLIRIYGTGTVGIGDNAVTITAADGYTDVDCENMESYKGGASKNSYVKIQNIDYPTLPGGKTGITLGSGISKVEITPRFYII